MYAAEPKRLRYYWRHFIRKKSHRKAIFRYSLLAGNLAVLVVIVLVVMSARGSGSASSSLSNLGAKSADAQAAINPLDQLSAANIAASVASMANLPEATAVQNQADTVSAQLAVSSSENVVAAETQVVATKFRSRKDILNYVVKKGDTLASLAAKFNVTSDSIKWSNNLKANTLTPGLKLVIPPVSGIIYTIQKGDTAQTLASKYSSNAKQITSFNDAEISGLKVGEQIVIPGGQPYHPQPKAPTASYGFYGSLAPSYGSNSYDYGYCTWYVANQIAVPGNWGNASSWAYYASATPGWNVSHAPAVGSIAQTANAAGGQGHVAIVDGVRDGGQQIKFRDMNGLAGFNRVGQSGWVSAATYQSYISH
ncbi:MAG: LysM peptidoglycan-binding domain-containing protein [Candidatus Saccharimonadales bacterium]